MGLGGKRGIKSSLSWGGKEPLNPVTPEPSPTQHRLPPRGGGQSPASRGSPSVAPGPGAAPGNLAEVQILPAAFDTLWGQDQCIFSPPRDSEADSRVRPTGAAHDVCGAVPETRQALKGCAQSCPTLCNAVDCSPPGSSVHGILQARVLEWAAISSSRGSSQPRD